jgi:enoyl ACP reductase
LSTIAARSIPGFELLGNLWDQRSALAWDFNDPVPAAKAAVVLLSDWMPKTTGEIIHVDGGVHAIGG